MSLLESSEVEIAYKCDLCGEQFNSADDAGNHNKKAHPESNSKDYFGAWVMGTSTPAEDREEERAK